ncbi:hypothetical protein J6590_009944 [Homalodisca vitripennis]|nr:hypothetical protein J6590_009944 [Homalodisca vitripennis]
MVRWTVVTIQGTAVLANGQADSGHHSMNSCTFQWSGGQWSPFKEQLYLPMVRQTVVTIQGTAVQTAAPCLARREGSERETRTSPPTYPLPCRCDTTKQNDAAEDRLNETNATFDCTAPRGRAKRGIGISAHASAARHSPSGYLYLPMGRQTVVTIQGAAVLANGQVDSGHPFKEQLYLPMVKQSVVTYSWNSCSFQWSGGQWSPFKEQLYLPMVRRTVVTIQGTAVLANG